MKNGMMYEVVAVVYLAVVSVVDEDLIVVRAERDLALVLVERVRADRLNKWLIVRHLQQ